MRSSSAIACAAALALAATLPGCTTLRSAEDTVSGWFGTSEPVRARYVGPSRVKLHREPDTSSEVVGELAPREGVLTYRSDGDFTWVRAESNGLTGWVLARQLVDTLPRARKPATAAPAAPSPAEAEQQAVEPTPEPEPEPEPPTPERSVFDPY